MIAKIFFLTFILVCVIVTIIQNEILISKDCAIKKMAKFEKVSYAQFRKDVIACFGEEYARRNNIKDIYDKIELPKRATTGSAGYDFKMPMDLLLKKNVEYLIPTGIKVRMLYGWVLEMFPRSGLGFKRGLCLLNTVGIIDGDYIYSDNEGHIMVKMTHKLGDYILQLKQGDSFVQGVFTQYGITEDDKTKKTRNGGFGSTDSK